jgi:hypothetical protein
MPFVDLDLGDQSQKMMEGTTKSVLNSHLNEDYF